MQSFCSEFEIPQTWTVAWQLGICFEQSMSIAFQLFFKFLICMQDMWLYLSNQETFSDFGSEGSLVWHETNIPYAVWSSESTRTLSLKYSPSQVLLYWVKRFLAALANLRISHFSTHSLYPMQSLTCHLINRLWRTMEVFMLMFTLLDLATHQIPVILSINHLLLLAELTVRLS